ncbi:MAG: hypothetical protein CV087_08805 [Candidatus Brocadia sp. WS118]|nr:MAG: hypothetical protein CV087_08805 [Candidatus Brocadia sp. WS118]
MKSVYRALKPITEADKPLLMLAELQGVDITPLAGADRVLGWAETKNGYMPIAVIDLVQTPYVVEPHVSWLPWASPRDKYEGFIWFIRQFDKTVFITVLKKYNDFHEMLVKRKILRKIGVLEVKQASEQIHFYQRIDNE